MTHSAPFSHIAYQLPDGTTGVLNNHDADALHDAAGSVDDENLATGAVTNGKIAAGVVTDAELAANAVTEAKIADGAVTSDKLSEDVWDSISQLEARVTAIENSPAYVKRAWANAGSTAINVQLGEGTQNGNGYKRITFFPNGTYQIADA